MSSSMSPGLRWLNSLMTLCAFAELPSSIRKSIFHNLKLSAGRCFRFGFSPFIIFFSSPIDFEREISTGKGSLIQITQQRRMNKSAMVIGEIQICHHTPQYFGRVSIEPLTLACLRSSLAIKLNTGGSHTVRSYNSGNIEWCAHTAVHGAIWQYRSIDISKFSRLIQLQLVQTRPNMNAETSLTISSMLARL